MSSVTTVRVTTSLTASFIAPASNGAAVSAYQLELWSPASSAYTEDLTLCPTATLFSDRACTIAFSALMGTYSYAVGELVIFRVRA